LQAFLRIRGGGDREDGREWTRIDERLGREEWISFLLLWDEEGEAGICSAREVEEILRCRCAVKKGYDRGGNEQVRWRNKAMRSEK